MNGLNLNELETKLIEAQKALDAANTENDSKELNNDSLDSWFDSLETLTDTTALFDEVETIKAAIAERKEEIRVEAVNKEIAELEKLIQECYDRMATYKKTNQKSNYICKFDNQAKSKTFYEINVIKKKKEIARYQTQINDLKATIK